MTVLCDTLASVHGSVLKSARQSYDQIIVTDLAMQMTQLMNFQCFGEAVLWGYVDFDLNMATEPEILCLWTSIFQPVQPNKWFKN